MRCFLFDIDGTVADLSHRLHHIEKTPKDWDSFFAECHGDAPIIPVVELARLLRSCAKVVFVSGRSDQCRPATEEWLRSQGLLSYPIYMRQEGDHRPDNIVKGELLDRILADGFEPIMAFDDRNQVVKMFRDRGLVCAQVAEGDF